MTRRRSCLPAWAEITVVAAKVTIFLLLTAALGSLVADALAPRAAPAPAPEVPRSALQETAERIEEKLDYLLTLTE